MRPRTPRSWKVPGILAGICVILLGGGALYVWWNTNLFGPDEYCDGIVSAETARTALDGPGRVTTEGVSADRNKYPEFRCELNRTSRLTGAADTNVVFETKAEQGDFLFQSAQWQQPAAMSSLPGPTTGAVGAGRGWLMLPEACWGKIERGGEAASSYVPTVQARVSEGSVNRAGMAQVLVEAAQKVTKTGNCSEGTAEPPEDISETSEKHQSAPAELCRLKGFSLPQRNIRLAGMKIDTERKTHNSQYWACDLHLAPTRGDGRAGSHLTFAATDNTMMTRAIATKREAFTKLPQGKGYDTTSGVLLHCKNGDVYLGHTWGPTIERTLHNKLGIHRLPAEREMLQRFIDAAAPEYSCPSVSLPKLS